MSSPLRGLVGFATGLFAEPAAFGVADAMPCGGAATGNGDAVVAVCEEASGGDEGLGASLAGTTPVSTGVGARTRPEPKGCGPDGPRFGATLDGRGEVVELELELEAK